MYAQHASDCPLRNGGDCTCTQVAYRASAKAPDERSRILSPQFATAIEARDWLRDQRARLTAATAVADEGPSVATVVQDFLRAVARDHARQGVDRGYSTEHLREVRGGLAYIETDLGERPIQLVRRRHVQALVDRLNAAGVPPARVHSVIQSLRVLFSYAIQRDLVDFNPIVQLTLPDPAREPTGVEQLSAYYNPNGTANGNGNGNGRPPAYADPDATVAYTPAFTAPGVPPSADPAAPSAEDHWTPGVFDRYEFRDDPFDSEPPAPAPRAPWVDDDPVAGTTYRPEPPPNSPEPPPYAQTPPPPAAQPPPYRGESWPDAERPAPYRTEPSFAPPLSAMPTAVGNSPLPATETRFGTPAYGVDPVTSQVPSQRGGQSPAENTVLSEQMFWWITRIVVIVFVLIALVLAAESV